MTTEKLAWKIVDLAISQLPAFGKFVREGLAAGLGDDATRERLESIVKRKVPEKGETERALEDLADTDPPPND
jgi:hypothetical protein